MADDDEVSKKPTNKSTTGWMICNNSLILRHRYTKIVSVGFEPTRYKQAILSRPP